MFSWAVHRGGIVRGRQIAWYQLGEDELIAEVNPEAFLLRKLKTKSITQAVGLLTSADLDSYATSEKTSGVVSVCCVTTVGLSNALRAGDPPSEVPRSIGTINTLCYISNPLRLEAYLEATALASEARTTAVLESRVLSSQTSLPATGTGTDCIVITAPNAVSKLREKKLKCFKYVGKHTEIGSFVGQTVYEATRSGIQKWIVAKGKHE